MNCTNRVYLSALTPIMMYRHGYGMGKNGFYQAMPSLNLYKRQIFMSYMIPDRNSCCCLFLTMTKYMAQKIRCYLVGQVSIGNKFTCATVVTHKRSFAPNKRLQADGGCAAAGQGDGAGRGGL